MSACISSGERRFVESSIEEDTRYDGRSLLDLRHLTVENGVIEFCNGSALIERVFCDSKVIVGVKVSGHEDSGVVKRIDSCFLVG